LDQELIPYGYSSWWGNALQERLGGSFFPLISD